MTFERARRPEQKEQRRAAILEATEALLAERELAKISLSEVGRRAGVSKANVYRYFESREAILLEILLQRAASLGADFERRLAPLSGRDDVDGVAEVIASTLIAHDPFMELFASVASVLEKNVSKDGIRSFKGRLKLELIRPINALHAALPQLSILDVRRVLTHVLLHASGLWAGAHPPPHVAEVLEEPELCDLKIDYAEALRDHARVVLRGVLAVDGT